jgi:glycolate oxidase FAD binding subunit
MLVSPGRIEEVQELVRGAGPGIRLLPVAGGTKPALSASARADVQRLDVSELSGVLEYDPAELTLTALAATPLVEVQTALSEHGQHLPFDPPLAQAGATLGGIVATGAAGAGAWRNGGVRDFVIGVRFVDGTGRLITGGAKVVKNAAGFDLAKLMVGSIGRLGVIVQLSFKVFPSPAATLTLELELGTLEQAVACVVALSRGPVELDALEVLPGGKLLVRLAGRAETLESRADRLVRKLEGVGAITKHTGVDEHLVWSDAAEFTWRRPDEHLIRVGLSIRQVVALDRALAAALGAPSPVRYGIGGTVAWIAWPTASSLDDLDTILCELGLPGMVLIGPPDRPHLGPRTGGSFGARVTSALDPGSRFLEV